MESMNANPSGASFSDGQPPAPATNPLEIVALVVSILALLVSFLPVVGLLLAVAGLILGIVARTRIRQGVGHGPSIGAISVSVLALLISLVITACGVVFLLGLRAMNQEFQKQGFDLTEIARELKRTMESPELPSPDLEVLRGQVGDAALRFATTYAEKSGERVKVDEADIRRQVEAASMSELLVMKRQLEALDLKNMSLEELKASGVIFYKQPTDQPPPEAAPSMAP